MDMDCRVTVAEDLVISQDTVGIGEQLDRGDRLVIRTITNI